MLKHDWVPLMSDINSSRENTYYWWKCANCKKQTEYLKKTEKEPDKEGCEATEKGSVFPLSSV